MKKYLLIVISLLAMFITSCASDMYASGGFYPVRPMGRSYALTSGWGYVTGDPIINNYLPYAPPYYYPNYYNYNYWWGYHP
ncbi:MAG: hypothetical protein D4R41_06820, partial [Sediminibacterium sp.]